MERPHELADGIYVLPSWMQVPKLGQVAVNAYLITGAEPILVDAGMIPERAAFLEALETLIDPADLRWIYLTHDDTDHIGALPALLERAPHAKVITTFAGVGKMSLFDPLPMPRVYLLNPGETLTAGDRTLQAFRPPLFDSPVTTGVFEATSKALFTSDSFGGVLQERVPLATDVDLEDLQRGQLQWATLDAPWVHGVDRTHFNAQLKSLEELGAEWLLSSHLPPAQSLTSPMMETLGQAPDAEPFASPNQAALEAMLAAG